MKKLVLIIFFIPTLFSAQEIKVQLNKQDSLIILKDYLTSDIYKKLEFKKYKENNSSKIKEIIKGDTNKDVIIRDINPISNPLIVINQFPLKDLKITEKITLKDIKEINISKPSNRLSEIYGSLAKYGLINIVMDKKVWRKLKRRHL